MPSSPLCPDGERVTLSVDTYGDDDRLPPGCVRIDVLYQTSRPLSCLQRKEVSKALRAILRRAILDERTEVARHAARERERRMTERKRLEAAGLPVPERLQRRPSGRPRVLPTQP